jgi:HlyD family secretion protein
MNPMMKGPQKRSAASDLHRVDGRQPIGPAGADSAGGSNGSGKTHMKGVTIRRVVLLVFMVAVLVAAWQWWQSRQPQLPAGIVSGNGRIEADEVDITTKYAGRVKEILVHEGDLVKADQVLARMDTAELQAALEHAKAELAKAEAEVREAQATIVQRDSELALAKQELARALPLVREGSLSQRTVDQRQSQRDTAEAALKAAQAHLVTHNHAVHAARAEVQRLQTQIDDNSLRAPVMGRVLYRLARPGEVLAAGGKTLTLVDLSEVYMEIFLPSQQAVRLSSGAPARIVLDGVNVVIPATVSFVSPEAQFTPKQVETRSEREKLMFRVKVMVPQELVIKHIEKVKTGVRGVAYVRLDDAVSWPAALESRLPGDQQ